MNRVRQMMAGMTPEQAVSNLMQTNPQFAKFVQENRGKTPAQIAREHGIDPSLLGIR